MQIAIWMLHDNGNSYFYVHSITKMLRARPNNGITKMVRSSEIVMFAEMILMLLVINYKETWYKNI